MTSIAFGEEKLDIGRVIELTFGVLKRRFLLLLGIYLSLLGLAVAAVLLVAGVGFGAAIGGGIAGGAAGAATGVLAALVLTPVVIAAFVALQVGLIQPTLAELSGERIDYGAAMQGAFKRVLPVFVLGLLMGLGILAGFLVFIVPGLILLTVWAVAIPVRVVEDVGTFDALRRSAALTKGNRWMIFALFLLVMIASGMLQGVIGAVLGEVASSIVGMLVGLVDVVGVAVLYAELRRIKDGVSPGDLASVFD